MQYYVTGTSEFFFTETGKIGLALFAVGSLMAGAFSWWWLGALAAVAERPYSDQPSLWLPMLAGVGAVAAVAGLFMVFIGRFLRHDINVRLAPNRD